MTVEFSQDALLRGNAKDRAALYSQNVQNGIMTRNECRQLENLPPDPDGNVLTAQSNLLPLAKLGAEPPAPAPVKEAPPPIKSEPTHVTVNFEDRKPSGFAITRDAAGNAIAKPLKD